MTHLKIEQNNGTRETVASGVIKKLYDLAKEIELDANGTIALKGWLYTSATYQDYITYLENISKVNNESQLTIDAGKKYISFEDPEVQRVLANRFGDSVGVTLSDMSSLTALPWGLFENNTTITSFNELGQFTSIKKIGFNCFNNATNLTSIDLSNIEEIESNTLTGTAIQIVNAPKLRIVADIAPSNIREIHIGSQVPDQQKTISLPNNFCRDRNSLQTVTGLKMVTTIGSACFYGCSNLTSLDLTSRLTSVGQYGFFGCSSLSSIDLSNVTSTEEHSFEGCTSLTSVDLSSCTSIGNSSFAGCTSLTTIDLSNVTSIGSDVFHGCTSLGQGQTLELNLTDQTFYPHSALLSTKYTRLILHSPQQQNTYDGRYPLYENMNQLQYLDLSDWRPAKSVFNNADYGDGSFYNNTSLVTYIAPTTVNNIFTMISALGNYSNFRYFILLSTTPPRIQTMDHNIPPSDWFYNKGGNVHIYVPDSAKAAYLADTDWASIGGYNGSDTIADRLHGLSELPAGVWTTGLASQYLTPAQLATS